MIIKWSLLVSLVEQGVFEGLYTPEGNLVSVFFTSIVYF